MSPKSQIGVCVPWFDIRRLGLGAPRHRASEIQLHEPRSRRHSTELSDGEASTNSMSRSSRGRKVCDRNCAWKTPHAGPAPPSVIRAFTCTQRGRGSRGGGTTQDDTFVVDDARRDVLSRPRNARCTRRPYSIVSARRSSSGKADYVAALGPDDRLRPRRPRVATVMIAAAIMTIPRAPVENRSVPFVQSQIEQ